MTFPSSVNLRSDVRRLKLAWPDVAWFSSTLEKRDVKFYSNYAGRKDYPTTSLTTDRKTIVAEVIHAGTVMSDVSSHWSGAHFGWQRFSSLMRSCT